MFEKVKANLPGPPEFLLCVLPERKNCDLYGNSLIGYTLLISALMNSSIFVPSHQSVL